VYNIGMTFDLLPGSYPEYKQAHDDLWPEIAASMSDNNVDMAIFRFGEQLFLHATAPTEQDWLKSREHPALVKWSDYMANLLVSDDDGQIVFHIMEEAFAFGNFVP
jgi:L-rhamnose mutarotase